MNMDQLLSKHSDNYRFHGVAGSTLSELVGQAEDGKIALWGTDHDEHVDNEDGEMETVYTRGAGFLYSVEIRNLDMAASEFCDGDGLVLVLEKAVSNPVEFEHSSDRRQCIIRAEEWNVIGGIRCTFNEDGDDIIEQEAISLKEIINQ